MNNTYANLEFGEHEYKLHIKCFIELYGYSTEKVNGIDMGSLTEKGFCKSERNRYTFQITGFIMTGQTLIVVFPKSHRLPSGFLEVMEHIKVLAGSLYRYKESGTLTPEENELLSGSGSGRKYNIAPALSIMKDYLNSGIIKRELKVQRSGHGAAVDWGRTVKKTEPFIYRKRAVYLDYIVREKSSDYTSKLVHLHREAVKKSFRLYGWLIDKNGLEKEIPDPSFSFTSNEISFILNQELAMTNSQREINLIRMMQQFFQGLEDKEDSEQLDTFATPYFHNVWEKMCGAIFKNEYDKLKHLVPAPIWYWNDKQKSTVQIPDILYRHNRKMYILDAKYYDTKRTLPGWHDLVKQFFYAYSMKETGREYMNVMIFPAVETNVLRYEGHSLIPGRPDLGRVEAVGLDTFQALNIYASYSSQDFRSELERLLECK